jgi:hypothetical protein
MVEGRRVCLGMQFEARDVAQRRLIQNGAQERLTDATPPRVREYGNATNPGDMPFLQKHPRGADRLAGAACQEMPSLRITTILFQCRRDALLDHEHGMTDRQAGRQRRSGGQHDDGFYLAIVLRSAHDPSVCSGATMRLAQGLALLAAPSHRPEISLRLAI